MDELANELLFKVLIQLVAMPFGGFAIFKLSQIIQDAWESGSSLKKIFSPCLIYFFFAFIVLGIICH